VTAHAVFDTVTLLQAAANPAGPAGGCLRLVTERKVFLHMSEAGFAELADVLGRAKVRKRFPQLTDEAVGTFLTGLRGLAQVPAEVPAAFRYGRDPDDEHILNLAIVTGSPYIVTRDNDLLDLMNEGNADGLSLKALHPTISILDPLAFLAAVVSPPATPGGESP
jgi:putative PIN family toxin of toxin-antitoxin system